MTTAAITTRTTATDATSATTNPATARVAGEEFAVMLTNASDRVDEAVTEPPATVAAPPTPPPSPVAVAPAPSFGGVGITPGTIGALLAAAGGSGSLAVAGTLAQLIGSTPTPSLPTGAIASTDVTLTGDMDQRRRALEPLFEAAGARYGVDPALLAAVAWTESSFQPDVVSHAGAIGLMQIMPGTAEGLGVDPRDPAQAIDGTRRAICRDALDQFGDVRLALAAYNAGPGAVASHGGIPPYPETMAYVVKVMDRYESLRGTST